MLFESAPTSDRRPVAFVILAAVSLLLMAVSLTTPQGRPQSRVTEVDLFSETAVAQAILGQWRTESHGERIITNRPDGTATMKITFDLLAGLIYGPTMTLELTWQLNDGNLVYQITSGQPEASTSRLINDYGVKATYRFHSIQPDRIHMIRVLDNDEQYIWTRIAPKPRTGRTMPAAL